MRALIDQLCAEKRLSVREWTALISGYTGADAAYAATLARGIADEHFGKKIYFRGIVEFTNHCKNDCMYCGLRRSNQNVERYRLTEDEIVSCCREGYALGYRTFVLQGGEDGYFTDERLCGLICRIKSLFPDAAVTLSVGERSRASYERLYAAGADRYLLRHETASKKHYGRLHPADMSFDNRMRCLRDLREIGYQTGCGMMVGSPEQTAADLAEDMMLIGRFRPHMIGIGPFVPHHDTPFRDQPAGSTSLTLFLLSLCRIMQPEVLLPATTALDCDGKNGREQAILAGANVIMPNLTPTCVRERYLLYDGKPGLQQGAADSLAGLKAQVAHIGFELEVGRGDYKATDRGLDEWD